MSTIQENLNECLNSISSSNSILSSSIQLLQSSTNDFPRVSSILHQNKVFTVVPEVDILQNKSNHSIYNKSIQSSLLKIDAELSKMQLKKQSLVQRQDLQKMRLQNLYVGTDNSDDASDNGKEIIGDDLELNRLKFLKDKKQRLNYSLSRLELQDKKRRLSMLP